MIILNLRRPIFLAVLSLLAFAIVPAQKSKTKAPAKPRSIVFAVTNDGRSLEPVAYVNKGKLEAPVDGGDETSLIESFNKTYYKPGTAYRLIFGSADAGSVKVKSSNAKADCSKNMAEVITSGTKTPLKGFVMGLATNAPGKVSASFRRKPTAAEKSVIEALVRSELANQKLTAKGALRYHNFTALDLENDGKPEFVGSYWVEIDKTTRGLLFFIAGQDGNGKHSIGYSDYRVISQGDVMSGDIKNVDEGVLHELLLDAFDYDGDGVGNIFTYVQSFEGAGFNAYSKNNGKWSKSFEGSNYHCGY